MRTLRILLSLAMVALFSTAAWAANVNISGAISGTYTLNSASISSNGDMTLNVSGGAPPSGQLSLSLSPTTLPSGTVGTAYNQPVTLTASGGTSPYSYSCSGSGVAGITASYDGKCYISGTPSAAGAYTVNASVTDSVSATASSSISFSVASGGGGGAYDCINLGTQFPHTYGCPGSAISACTPQVIQAKSTANYCFVIDKPTVGNIVVTMNSADWTTSSHEFVSDIKPTTSAEAETILASGSQSNKIGTPPWYSFAIGSNERVNLVQNAVQGKKYYVTVYNPGSVQSLVVIAWFAY